MPTYQYACTECDHTLEQVQAFTDDALTECPVCHGRLRKKFNAVGVVFKGSGFYRNDSRSGGGDGGDGGSSEGTSGAKSETKTDGKAETKSETKAATTSETSSTTASSGSRSDSATGGSSTSGSGKGGSSGSSAQPAAS